MRCASLEREPNAFHNESYEVEWLGFLSLCLRVCVNQHSFRPHMFVPHDTQGTRHQHQYRRVLSTKTYKTSPCYHADIIALPCEDLLEIVRQRVILEAHCEAMYFGSTYSYIHAAIWFFLEFGTWSYISIEGFPCPNKFKNLSFSLEMCLKWDCGALFRVLNYFLELGGLCFYIFVYKQL